jgi:methane monooxygenase component A gamma chain
MANKSIRDNPTRKTWMEHIGKLSSVDAATKFVQEFRHNHTSPFRTNYELDLDYLFIERKIEEKLAMLKSSSYSDDALFTTCTTGELAADVVKKWLAKMAETDCKYTAEKVLVEFRQLYKTPVMPVNQFLKADTVLGTRLMELRNTDYEATSLEDLRKERGVKVLYLGVPKAA